MDRLDTGRTAGDLGRPRAGDAARERDAVRADELHRRAGLEVALAADDTDGEQAAAVHRDRAACPFVDVEPPHRLLREAEPELVCGQLALGAVEPGPTRLAREDRPEDVARRAVG